MKTITFLAATVIVIATRASLPAEEKEPGARKALVGVWKGFAVEGEGENPDRGPVKLQLTISESTIKGSEHKGSETVNHGEGVYSLDLTQNPAHLDASKSNERGRKESYLGIYRLEGDTLKWCVTRRKQRPSAFATRDGAFLLVLKRDK
jgi:uncharacterized protein (TIGR03067 family)